MKQLFNILFLLLVFAQSQAQRRDDPATYLKSLSKKLPVILKASNFEPGDYVADIGASHGWLDAAIGIYEDSLHFYLEDIDSSVVKNSRLQEALTEYSNERGKPITCTYVTVIGTGMSTTLADTLFDKILLVDTYHHLQYRDEMIDDMKRILKHGGKLIVYEPLANQPGEIFKPCNSLVYTSDEVISSFRDKGFQFEGVHEAGKSGGKKVKVFVFGKWE